ncbi:MAG: indolepyruvate oxidoreductase subunit beta [Candidatus Sumerlaeia bacterium]|nr:indolepyruvate oxidoreductase subunit beta [Candidatus Sumerlaeia bacterium]
MKYDILVAGVGGQGIISIATVLAEAALAEGLHVKQSEIHGMAQRGGAVHSHLRLSSRPIAADVIPLGGADMVLSVEPMEALRYLPYLAPSGWVVANSMPFVNIANYPEVARVHGAFEALERHVLFDADRLAKEAGSPKAMNMAMLGAASRFVPLSEERFVAAIRSRFASKGERIVEANLAVFRAGRAAANLPVGERIGT